MSDEQVQTGLGTQTRRTLLAGAGAVGATVVLAACGDDGDESAPAGGAPSAAGEPQGGGTPAPAGPLARTADIPVGGGVVYAAQGVVITQPEAGTFKAFDPICTHKGCPVSKVDAGTIICTCHNSKFSVADGSVKGGPATKPLAEKRIKVDGDQITLA